MPATTRFCRTILVLFILSCTTLAAQELFEPTGGPPGGLFWTLASSTDGSGILYAGTQTGTIWRSTDNGHSWIGSRSGISHGRVHEVAPHPNGTIFATIGGIPQGLEGFIQALYRSTDGGDTWMELNKVASLGGLIRNVLTGSGQTVFAMVDSGVFRSTDNGESWKRITELTGKVFSAAVRTASGELLILSYEDGGAQLYRSTDNGDSWKPVGHPLPDTFSGIFSDGDPLYMTENGTILLATAFDGVLRLNQGGEWVSSSEGLLPSMKCYAITAGENGMLFVGTERGVFRSTNDGLNWEQTSSENLRYEVFDLVSAMNTDLLAGTRTQLYRTSNNGTVWVPSAVGIIESDVISMAAGSGVLFASLQDGTVWRSVDRATSWQLLPLQLPEQTNVSVLALRGDGVLFCGTNGVYVGDGTAVIYRSFSNGDSWTSINVGITATAINNITFGPGQTLFAATDSGLFRSTNNGDIWISMKQGLPASNILSVLVAADGSVLAGTKDNGAWRSTDNGQTWQDANNGITTPVIRDLSLNRQTGTILAAGSRSSGGYRSTDHGNTWRALAGGLPENADIFTLRTDGFKTTLMSISDFTPSFPFNVIARSMDDGETWEIIDTTVDLVRKIEFDSLENVYLSIVQAGVWRNISQVTMGLPSARQMVDAARLTAGISAEDVMVSFTLPSPSMTSLALFNSQGEQLMASPSEYREAGEHHMMIESGGLPGGVYFCRLQLQGQVVTRAFTIVR